MIRKVTIKNGRVRGLPAADPRITVYKGIPYAAPPVGELRWKAPQPAKDWEGTLFACEFPPLAMQEIPGKDPDNIYTRDFHVDSDLPMSEDCLYLNVWTPQKAENEKLPVMVWFFGGGLNSGYPGEMEFDGERLARRSVVVVTINYRLNVFGFLAYPQLSAERKDNCITNFSLYDQRYSLFWVKENISAFGGDPDNITIFGQSGGGRSVLFQAISPLNDTSVFQKAISMSGSGITVGFIEYQTLKEAEESGKQFFDYLGVKNLAEARKISAEEMEKASLAQKFVRWGAVIDGIFLPDQPYKLLAAGKRMDIPLMAGHTTADLGDFFRDDNTPEKFAEKAKKYLGNNAPKFLSLCEFEKGNFERTRRLAEINHQRLCIELMALRNQNLSSPFYFYRFGPEMPGWDNPGAFHSSDLWFAFETLAKCWRPFKGKHYDLARQMCNYWANFARSGNPNGPDADGEPMPHWLPYTEYTPWSMDFLDTSVMNTVSETDAVKYLLDHITL